MESSVAGTSLIILTIIAIALFVGVAAISEKLDKIIKLLERENNQ